MRGQLAVPGYVRDKVALLRRSASLCLLSSSFSVSLPQLLKCQSQLEVPEVCATPTSPSASRPVASRCLNPWCLRPRINWRELLGTQTVLRLEFSPWISGERNKPMLARFLIRKRGMRVVMSCNLSHTNIKQRVCIHSLINSISI